MPNLLKNLSQLCFSARVACFYYTKTKCSKADVKLAPLQGINRKNTCWKRITWHFENWCSCLLNKYTICTCARLLPPPHESVCTFFNLDVSHLSIIFDCFCPFSVWTDFIFDPVTACWNIADITPSFYHLSRWFNTTMSLACYNSSVNHHILFMVTFDRTFKRFFCWFELRLSSSVWALFIFFNINCHFFKLV